ncbi:MAG: branched-chain amino acid ABC transporter permease [Candidatus Methylomirabilia bacterium]
MIVLQLLFNGIATGAIYSLIALGLVMILRALDLINFAHGDLVMVGGFLVITLNVTFGLPFPLAFVLAVLAVGLVGLVIERLCIRTIKGTSLMNVITATIGVGLILQTWGLVVYGGEAIGLPHPLGEEFLDVFGLKILPQQLLIISMTLFLMLLLQAFFYITRTGMAMRAVMNDRETASLMGVNVQFMTALTFAISIALGGAAGILVAPMTFVTFNMGIIVIKAFTALILGGMFSFGGAIVGGLLLGVFENFLRGFVSSAYGDTIIFTLLILVLISRPEGLFTTK